MPLCSQKLKRRQHHGHTAGTDRFDQPALARIRYRGTENWRYELTREEIFDNQAVAEIRLYVKIDGDWLCKGSHKGQMQIIKGNVGDAQKGAITDAIQKCMSLLSIGSDAYKGLLKNVYQQRKPPSIIVTEETIMPKDSIESSLPIIKVFPGSSLVIVHNENGWRKLNIFIYCEDNRLAHP